MPIPTRTSATLAAGVVLVLGAGGCGHATAMPPASATPPQVSTTLPASSPTTVAAPTAVATSVVSSTAPSTLSASVRPTASSSLGVDDDGAQASATAASAPLVLDARAKSSAASTAVTVMRLFVRRDVTATAWWADLAPHLSDRARYEYRGTDPRNVPATRVSGGATITPASLPQVARASVPTDVGAYLVILVRTPDQPQWQVDQIVPPENLGGD